MEKLVNSVDLKSTASFGLPVRVRLVVLNGILAQLVEHRTFNPLALGSSPRGSTTNAPIAQ